ncbi:MAG: hypothetical protein JJT85_08105 [Chromatiales bacterium]|nr:hypothetical protein [Chromatiales bacterium]
MLMSRRSDGAGQRARRICGLAACLLSAPAAVAQPAAVPDVAALFGYGSAVQLHLPRDPALAAGYIFFWNALAGAGDPAALAEGDYAALVLSSESVIGTLRRRYAAGPADYRLVDALTVALPAFGSHDAPGIGQPPEQLLARVDRVLAPRVLVNGRYEFAGSLQEPADLGFAPDLWLRCHKVPACVAAHDQVFGAALGGVPMTSGLAERIASDALLAAMPELPVLAEGIAVVDRTLRGATLHPSDAAAAAAGAWWQAVGSRMDQLPGAEPPSVAELGGMMMLGRGSAWLAGQESLAGSFTAFEAPLLGFARLGPAARQGGGIVAAAAGMGLVVAGVQALALLEQSGGQAATARREMERIVGQLHESTYRNHLSLRTEGLLTSNRLDARLVGLGIALEVVKDDLSRIEGAQRARLRAEFLVQDARRWSGFDEEHDRCFSLRGRSGPDGLLRPADFRRCEDSFLQGAVRRAQYSTRSRDYILDARFLEAGDLRFPFHHHYPLLLTEAGMELRSALSLVDPFEWQQHAVALMRLYQEHAAAPEDYPRRAETLRNLRAAGARIQDALHGLVTTNGTGGQRFRDGLHDDALAAYRDAVERLLARVRLIDDPAADPHGKRLTEPLQQPLPDGPRRAAIEAMLSSAAEGRSGLAACADVPADAFLAPESGLASAARRFFDAPITAGELARSWNAAAIEGFRLQPDSWAALVPGPWLWAALDGHGELQVCLARFQPVIAEFTREEMPARNQLRANVRLEAALEVRFKPSPALRSALALPAAHPPLVIARYEGARSCTFGYRSDAEGCSRGECLAMLAPELWSVPPGGRINDGECAGPPFPQQLAQGNRFAGASELLDLAAGLELPFWSARAARVEQLRADAARSSEYNDALAAYLAYFALAGTTLATWPDPSDPLAPLFTVDDPLAPRAILGALIDDRQSTAEILARVDAGLATVRERVRVRGAELERDDPRRLLPQLRGLAETLARIDLMLTAYQETG